MKPNFASRCVVISTALSMAGCAVTHGTANSRADAVKREIEGAVAAQAQYTSPEKNPLYKRIRAVYIGSKSAPIMNNAALPPALNELNFQLPKRVNLATAAKNIAALSKYPVRINPDVYAKVASSIDAANPMGQATPASIPNLLSATIPDSDTSLPTDFDGPLKDYLNTICAALNINWEFEPSKGFYFYRYVTKVLEVKLHAGDNSSSTNVMKGSQANTGARSTGGGSGGASEGTGSFNSSSSVRSNAFYAPWLSLENAIKAVLTPAGKIAVDISSNSIIVRDSRDAVEEAEKIVARANEVHNRLITLRLRILRVAYDDTSAASANFQAVYNRVANGLPDYRLNLTSPGTLVGSDAGGLGYAVLNSNSRWNGTDGLLQALNQLGTIVSDETETYPVMNRRTIPVTSFDTDTYLAETTPATGGTLTGGGVPGLKPGTLTTGFFLQMTPTAYDDGTVWIDMALDQSEKRGPFGTTSTGSGDTFQQIQLPNTHVETKSPTVAVKAGETLMLVNVNRDSVSHSRRSGVFGASGSGERRRQMQVILVTPFVRTL